MQKIKAVFFDLDGTLADTLPVCIQAFRQSLEPLINRPLSDEEIISNFGPSEEGAIMALAPGHFNKGLADYLYHYEILHKMCSAPFDGITELLDTLKNKGVHIALITGKGKYSNAISLKHLDLAHFFEFIETGSPTGPVKAECIQKVLNTLEGVEKQEVIYVGDSGSDITESRKAGIPVIAAAWAGTSEPDKLKELNPDELFFTIAEFKEWLLARI